MCPSESPQHRSLAPVSDAPPSPTPRSLHRPGVPHPALWRVPGTRLFALIAVSVRFCFLAMLASGYSLVSFRPIPDRFRPIAAEVRSALRLFRRILASVPAREFRQSATQTRPPRHFQHSPTTPRGVAGGNRETPPSSPAHTGGSRRHQEPPAVAYLRYTPASSCSNSALISNTDPALFPDHIASLG